MGRFVASCLALCTGMTLAWGARAGGIIPPTVTSPFGDPVCLDPIDVTNTLANPSGYYAISDQCESLCKKAASDCKQYVRLAFACTSALLGDDVSYQKKDCEREFADDNSGKKECKAGIDNDSGVDRQALRNNRDGALATCEEWGAICRNSCNQP